MLIAMFSITKHNNIYDITLGSYFTTQSYCLQLIHTMNTIFVKSNFSQNVTIKHSNLVKMYIKLIPMVSRQQHSKYIYKH